MRRQCNARASYGRPGSVSESIVAVYEALWLLTQQMLEAARNEEWDSLIGLGQQRGALVDIMKGRDDVSAMTAIEQQQTGEIIHHILAADAEIRLGTEAWMGELQEMLGSISAEKKLHKAYETP